MLKRKTPERVNDDACPESEELPPQSSDLVEIVKRNGEFRKWGMFWGPLLYLRTLNAIRPRSFWWKGLLAVVTAVGGLLAKYGLPALVG